MAVSTTISSSLSAQSNSSHATEAALRPFLQADFDPVTHLNAVLPTLSLSSTARDTATTQHGRSVPLPELATQLQSLLSQLNAQVTRLSNNLTQLTDEIIRSGGRLAYEVEVLRGETLGLTDSLDHGLRRDMDVLLPEKVDNGEQQPGTSIAESTASPAATTSAEAETTSADPQYLDRLRTLTAVRVRLDAVINVFGDAMQWPIAPSELSLASSLISISTPDPSEDGRSREEKGKEFSEKLRHEVSELLGSANDFSGVEAAESRIADLRRLAEVWKGTAEEKARAKLVEGLHKMVEDRQKAVEKGSSVRKPVQLPTRGGDLRYGNTDTATGGYGFLQNLRSLRSDVYIE